MVAQPMPSRWVRSLRPAGIVLVIVGGLALGLMALASMVTLMSDPATPWVGFVPGQGGTPTVVVGPAGAAGVTSIVVEAPDAEHTVVWAIDRVPGSSWDGSVALGTVPQGFVPTTERRGATIPRGSTLLVTNGCYGSYVSVPHGTLKRGVVTTDDQQVTLEEFAADEVGFTPCGPTDLSTPVRIAGAGLAILVVGLVALVAGTVRRTGNVRLG